MHWVCFCSRFFLCWPWLYESSRWCADKPVFRFKSWPLSVTRIIIEIMCSARIGMQQGSLASSLTKTTKVWRGKNMFVFSILKRIYWVEEAWARPVSPTDQWPPCNHFLLSKFLKCWMILLRYLLYLLTFWIFTISSRKLTKNDEIKTQNSK